MVTDVQPRVRLASLLARLGVLAALVLALVTTRVVWSSRVEWHVAQSRLRAGDHAQAIDHWGRAARLYAPANPYSSRSRQALAAVATEAEVAGDSTLALSAWRELRSSILATRSFYTPAKQQLNQANSQIARLAALAEAPAPDAAPNLEARQRWHAELLARDDAPSVAWTLVALLGLIGWIAAAIGLLWRGLDDQDRLRTRAAAAWGAGILVGILLFFLGLARA